MNNNVTACTSSAATPMDWSSARHGTVDEDGCDSRNSSSMDEDDGDDDSNNSFMDGQSGPIEPIESVHILKQDFDLPKSLCALPQVFNELFSASMWSELPADMKQHLMANYLPTFPENDAAEKEATVQKLFAREPFRFGSAPLVDFQRNLEEGTYLADVIKYRNSIARSERHERRYQECERVSRLAQRLAASRNRLLKHVHNTPFGTPAPKIESDPVAQLSNKTLTAIRAKKRYYSEITSIAEELNVVLSDDNSADEDDDDGLAQQRRKHGLNRSSLKSAKKVLAPLPSGPSSPTEMNVHSTFSYKNGTVDPLHTAAATTTMEGSGSGSKMKMGCARNESLGRESHVTDSYYKSLLQRHRKRKVNEPDHPELEVNDIALQDVFNRSQLVLGMNKRISMNPTRVNSNCISNKKSIASLLKHELALLTPPRSTKNQIKVEERLPTSQSTVNAGVGGGPVSFKAKPKSLLLNATGTSANKMDAKKMDPKMASARGSNNSNSLTSSSNSSVANRMSNGPMTKKFKSEAESEAANVQRYINSNLSMPTSLFNEHLGSDYHISQFIEASATDLDVDSRLGNSLRAEDDHLDTSLTFGETTFTCFLSLIREIFCSTPDHRTTKEHLQRRVRQWLSNPKCQLNTWFLDSDNWYVELASAVHFLCGEFLDQPADYVPYIDYKAHLRQYQWIGAGRDTDQHLLPLCKYWLSRHCEMGAARGQGCDSVSDDLLDQSHSPVPLPPYRVTTWAVRPETAEEIGEFRRQERQRFERPNQPYTYRLHGYESVVGPVKGLNTQVPGGNAKARGHNMLAEVRPHFITMLTLVRDATARLPNGEGTRADICELLKASQYIAVSASTGQESVLQPIVSGALDRMHAEPDPCVRYEPKRKIWIYLHRHRSEEDFIRLQGPTTTACATAAGNINNNSLMTVAKTKKVVTKRMVKPMASPVSVPRPMATAQNKNVSTVTANVGQKVMLSPSLVKMNSIVLPNTQTTSSLLATNQQQHQQSIIVLSSSPPNARTKLIATTLPQGSKSMYGTAGQNIVKIQNTSKVSQMPALSTIASGGGQQQQPGQPPPPLNKIIQSGMATTMKAELVPIGSGGAGRMESRDIEANMDAQNPPNLIQKPMPTLIIDSGNKFSKLITTNSKSPTMRVATSSPGTVQMIRTPGLIAPRQRMPVIQAGANQSVLVANNPQQIRPATGGLSQTIKGKVAAGSILISPNQATVYAMSSAGGTGSSSSSSNSSINSNISVNSQTGLEKLQQLKMLRATTTTGNRLGPTITSGAATPPGQAAVSIGKTKVMAGKSLINQAVMAKMRVASSTGSAVTSSTSTVTMGTTSGTVVGQKQQVQIANATGNISIIGNIVSANGSILKSAGTGQKQILQNMIVTSNQKRMLSNAFVVASAGGKIATTPTVSTAAGTNAKSIYISNASGDASMLSPNLIKIRANVAATCSTVTPTTTTTTFTSLQAAATKLSSSSNTATATPHIIQIQQGSAGGKVQPMSSLTQQQQQTILNTLRQQRQVLKTSTAATSPTTSSLIIKSPVVQQQQQLQQQRTTMIKAQAPGQTIGNRLVKPGGNMATISTTPTTTIIRPGNGGQQQFMAKVLTDGSGQVVSLDSLMAGNSGIAKQTSPLRVAKQQHGTVAGQSNLIQLATAGNASGNAGMAQYAVVSPANRIIQVQGGGGQKVLATKSTGGDAAKVVASTAVPQSTQQRLAASAPQQTMSTKIVNAVGTATAANATIPNRVKSGIRMLNASNLNITHIGGKPVLITGKATTTAGGTTGTVISNSGAATPTSAATTTTSLLIGGQTVKVQGNLNQAQHVMIGNQLVKIQSASGGAASAPGATILKNSNPNAATALAKLDQTAYKGQSSNSLLQHQQVAVSTSQQSAIKKNVVTMATNALGTATGQLVNKAVVTSATGGTAGGHQRVVFALQSGGQLILPQSFPSGSINLKTLQGLKMVPLQQQQQQQGQQQQAKK